MLIIEITGANKLKPLPIKLAIGTGIVQITIATAAGVNPSTARIPFKRNNTVKPNTHGININGFNTIGRPYMIGSAILKIVPGRAILPKVKQLGIQTV